MDRPVADGANFGDNNGSLSQKSERAEADENAADATPVAPTEQQGQRDQHAKLKVGPQVKVESTSELEAAAEPEVEGLPQREAAEALGQGLAGVAEVRACRAARLPKRRAGPRAGCGRAGTAAAPQMPRLTSRASSRLC